mmetsp:Transcript_7560/g.22151  ORF Transcript_7560/g.22151 Transcript_7560/m.22151 type:complete len:117 (+) Transcript_7560:1254-1604(+)
MASEGNMGLLLDPFSLLDPLRLELLEVTRNNGLCSTDGGALTWPEFDIFSAPVSRNDTVRSREVRQPAALPVDALCLVAGWSSKAPGWSGVAIPGKSLDAAVASAIASDPANAAAS